jgi:hypothetical protein
MNGGTSMPIYLDNGATVVVVFYTNSPNGPLAPRITINITLPD